MAGDGHVGRFCFRPSWRERGEESEAGWQPYGWWGGKGRTGSSRLAGPQGWRRRRRAVAWQWGRQWRAFLRSALADPIRSCTGLSTATATAAAEAFWETRNQAESIVAAAVLATGGRDLAGSGADRDPGVRQGPGRGQGLGFFLGRACLYIASTRRSVRASVRPLSQASTSPVARPRLPTWPRSPSPRRSPHSPSARSSPRVSPRPRRRRRPRPPPAITRSITSRPYPPDRPSPPPALRPWSHPARDLSLLETHDRVGAEGAADGHPAPAAAAVAVAAAGTRTAAAGEDGGARAAALNTSGGARAHEATQAQKTARAWGVGFLQAHPSSRGQARETEARQRRASPSAG